MQDDCLVKCSILCLIKVYNLIKYFKMSTTYMVKSSLVFLACHINIVLMTILYLFNISKSTSQNRILNVLQMMLYILGVCFNIYVVLYASRKWELIWKYFENSTRYLSLVQQEIKSNILNSIKASMQQLLASAASVLETLAQTDSGDSTVITSEPSERTEQLTTKEEISTITRVQAKVIEAENFAKSQTADEKTPELKMAYNLRPVNRPKSDPIKKTFRQETIKPQSPELLKNKIFKSRMNLTLDSSFCK